MNHPYDFCFLFLYCILGYHKWTLWASVQS